MKEEWLYRAQRAREHLAGARKEKEVPQLAPETMVYGHTLLDNLVEGRRSHALEMTSVALVIIACVVGGAAIAYAAGALGASAYLDWLFAAFR